MGYGGVAVIETLGHTDVHVCHLNEGHSALLTLALLEARLRERQASSPDESDRQFVQHRCVFTTHRPVPAGHDQFPLPLVRQVLGDERVEILRRVGVQQGNLLNMTEVALSLSRYTNGVAIRHGEVSRDMFPAYPVDSITNGVHAATWISPPLAILYDHYLPDWRQDNFHLRHSVGIPLEEIRAARRVAKHDLVAEVTRRSGAAVDPNVFTIGFARRATAYKRPDLLFSDLDRRRGIARAVGPFQIVYGGKAHPRDDSGKVAIRRVFAAASALRNTVPDEADAGEAGRESLPT